MGLGVVGFKGIWILFFINEEWWMFSNVEEKFFKFGYQEDYFYSRVGGIMQEGEFWRQGESQKINLRVRDDVC